MDEKQFQERLLRGQLPEHVAIIMDGNGRWAKKRALPRVAGHREGINSVREIVRACGELGIGYLKLAYTEIYVTDALWPDFRRKEFYNALLAYQQRERRFGKVSEQLTASPAGVTMTNVAAEMIPAGAAMEM